MAATNIAGICVCAAMWVLSNWDPFGWLFCVFWITALVQVGASANLYTWRRRRGAHRE